MDAMKVTKSIMPAKQQKLTFTHLGAFIMRFVSVFLQLPGILIPSKLWPAQVFFDTVPFHGINDFQIVRLVMDGKRPGRLEMPKMEDNTWNLIQNCWETIPSKRQTMEEIVAASTPLPGT